MSKLIVKVLLVLAVVGLTARESWAQGSAADEHAIRQGQAQFVEAWNKGDAAGLAGLYTSDAVRVTGGARWSGRAEIEKQTTGQFANRTGSPTLTSTPTVVRFLASNVAVMHTDYAAAGNKGMGEWVWVKQGGSWLIASHMSMPVPQP